MIKIAVLNRLRLGRLVAAKISPKLPNTQRWLGVYPLNPDEIERMYFLKREKIKIPAGTHSMWWYRIRIFEVEISFPVEEWYLSENELLNSESYVVFSEEELIQQLIELQVDPTLLEAPWKCDYPL